MPWSPGALAREYPAAKMCAWSAIHSITAFARASLALEDDRPQEAAETLRELHHEAETKSWNHFALVVGTELSKALLAASEPFEALHAFCDVLKGTASAGIYQMVLDGGPQIGKLLQMFCERAQLTASFASCCRMRIV